MWWFEFVKHLSYLKNHEGGRVTGEREFCLSGNIALAEIKSKAKVANLSVHEYILAALSHAVYRVTEGKERHPFNLVIPVNTKDSVSDLSTFQPGNAICATFNTMKPCATMSEAYTESTRALDRFSDVTNANVWYTAQNFF